MLVKEEFFVSVDMKAELIKGATKDEKTNSFHRDLVELSAVKLMKLAAAIQPNASRMSWQEVREVLRDAIKAGRIKTSDLAEKIQDRIAA